MLRYGFAAFLVGIMAVAASHTRTSAADDPVTFSKHVLPILQKNCQSCHRPGQMAPMSLVTYRDARPWARSMKAKVESRQMPPWFADPAHGPFANDRSLSQTDIETIAKWADAGAVEGDPKDAPPPVEWPADGWQIKPDIIVRGPEFRVPARTKNDVVEWITYLIPSGFTKDTWITSLEIKPSVMEVTHHICFTFVAHRPDAKYYVPNWAESDRDDEGVAIGGGNPPARQAEGGRSGPGRQPGADVGGGFNCFVPGRDADDYRKFGAGKLIPAGTDISIPPNEPNYKSPPFDLTFTADVELVEFMPHMHVRGKSMTYHLVYPDGRDQIVLSVPKYDFNWQLLYQPAKTIRVPKGTRMYVEAYYDNSRANRHNPNPERTVHLGRMTWEEMMAPFFGILIDANVDPNKVIRLGRFTAIGDGA